MKKWLKSLFKTNSLNEIEDEFEEKPVEEKVDQSHSIEKKRNALNERPNFRFPIELDEEIPPPKPIKETKVEPVFKQEKIDDIWQKSSKNLNKEFKPTYNESTNLVRNTIQSNLFDKSNLSSRLETKQDSKSEKEQTKVEKEEKVDIVFRPKRKTPFRPSEYISPIYGYQRPPKREESNTHSKHTSIIEESVEASQISNVLENSFKQVKIDNFEKESFNNQNHKSIEVLNLVEKEESKTEATQVGNIELLVKEHQNEIKHALKVEDVQLETHEIKVEETNEELEPKVHQVEIKVEETNEELEPKVHQVEIKVEETNEELERKVHQVEAEVEDANEELERKVHQVEAEVEDANEELERKVHQVEAEVEDANEELERKVHQVEAEVEEANEELEPEVHQVEAEVENMNENLVSETHQVELEDKETNEVVLLEELPIEADIKEKEVQSEVKSNFVSIKEDSEEDHHSLESLNMEDNTVQIESNDYKVETLVQYDVNEDKVISLVQHNEVLDVESELTDESDVDIKEFKEEAVHQESSSVESQVEGNVEINQQSVTNSNEEIMTEIETTKEETEPKPIEKRQKKRHFPFNVMMLRSDVEASRKANIMRQLRELQNESAATVEKVNEKVESKQNEQMIENASLSEQSENLSSEKIQQSEMIGEANNHEHEQTFEVIQNQPILEIEESKTETNLTQETKNQFVLTDEPQSVDELPPVLYELPELDLLVEPPIEQFNDGDWVEDQKQLLQETLLNFNVGAKVIAATQGPTVTRFEVQPDPGVKVNKITNLQDDIKLSLAARDIRIEAPIPGRSAIGIEVPNKESKPVYLRELVSQDKFLQSESPLTVALGLDIGGEPVYADISKMPHGLIAGATGSGKSVCINSILVSILYKAKPHEVKLILIDPKMVELAPYNHIPHLISPVITDARAATAALKWACEEMDRRYDLFAHAGARDIKRFNDLAKKKGAYNDELPYLVIIIDELADLMMVSPGDVETYICRIAQKARACGIHLLVATQRPSVDVITGIIKSNIPTRIAFTVSSQVDSRTIIDIGGAEKLLGRGDMLFLDNGKSQAIRLQGVYVSDDEIEHVVEIVKDQQKPNYLFNQEELVAKADAQDVDDELFEEAVEFVIDQKGASVSMLQRRFRIGYNRAARLMDLMFDHGIVSNQNGSKPRDVLITSMEEFRSE
ncbi:DNA translocase FtsK [Bacillus sp. AL-1R]